MTSRPTSTLRSNIKQKQTSFVSTGSRKISPGSFAWSCVNVFDNTVVRGFNFRSTTLKCDFTFNRLCYQQNISSKFHRFKCVCTKNDRHTPRGTLFIAYSIKYLHVLSLVSLSSLSTLQAILLSPSRVSVSARSAVAPSLLRFFHVFVAAMI